MNKGIANMLKTALLGLPFIEKYGGLVSVQEKTDTFYPDDTNVPRTIITRFPVTSDYTITREGNCEDAEVIDFIPNELYKGMIYFEDGGLDPLPRLGKLSRFSAKLQLVAWINTTGIVKESDNSALNPAQISTAVFAAINAKLDALENKTIGNFVRLNIKLLKVLPQTRSIFSTYNYNESATQYLMPPFEFFAYSLAVEFSISPTCITDITTIPVTC